MARLNKRLLLRRCLLKQAASSVHPPRLLMASSNNGLRELLSFSLRSEGFEVQQASDGLLLLEDVASSLLEPQRSPPYEMVILDCALSGCSTEQLLGALEGSSWCLPIVLLNLPPDRQQLCLRVAAAFGQVFQLEDLLTAALNLLPAHRPRPCSQRQAQQHRLREAKIVWPRA